MKHCLRLIILIPFLLSLQALAAGHSLPYEETFDSWGSGWPVSEDGITTRYPEDGGYELCIDGTEQSYFVTAPVTAPDSYIVQVKLKAASGDGSYSLWFNLCEGKGYVLTINPSRQRFVINGFIKDQKVEEIKDDQSDAIKRNDYNILKVAVVKNQAQLYANGQLLASITIEYSSNNMGLGISASNASHEPLVVHLESFSVTETKSLPKVAVPWVVGETFTEAKNLIEAQQLQVEKTEAYSDSVSEGSVISQDPSGNTTVVANSVVTVTVSKGVKKVSVPWVVGDTFTEAESMIEAQQLRVKKTESYSDSVAEGSVISQNPSGNTNVAVNSVVTVIVSKGLEKVTVPNVVGRTFAEAKNLIEAQRLQVEKTEAYSDSVSEGSVISQDPSGHTTVVTNSIVTVTVSKGRERVTVPNLVGLCYTDAMNILQKLNLYVVPGVMDYSNYQQGVVYSQSPSPNTKVEPYSMVTICVSLGPPPQIFF